MSRPVLGWGFIPIAGVSSPPSFDPTRVAGLLAWYDSRTYTVSTGKVTTAPDGSGNGNNATAPAGQEPTYTASNASFNNLPSADCPASGTKRLSIPNLGIGTSAFTVVFVGNSASASNGYAFSSADTPDTSLLTQGGVWAMTRDAFSHSLQGGSPSSASVVVGVFNGGSSKLYANAHTAIASGNAGANNAITTFNAGQYQSPSGVFSLNGSIVQLLFYSGALSQGNAEYLLDGFGSLAGISIGA